VFLSLFSVVSETAFGDLIVTWLEFVD